MLKLDALNQLKQLKSDIKASRDLQFGRVKGTGQKFAFVSLESGRDVFLPPDEMLKVLPGDRIEVEIKKDDKNKTFAKVERLIESSNKIFFGKYVSKGAAHFAEADFDGTSRWIFIPPNKRGNAKVGDLLQCKLVQHPIKNGKPQAHILDNLGNEKDAGIEWTYSLKKHGIEEAWSEKSEQDLKTLTEDLVAKLCAEREDFSQHAFFTIDGERTTDMDDALCIDENSDGWKLLVAIADPEALVKHAPVLEKEALQRGASLYAPNKVVSMLPEEVSANLASLVEGKTRLAKVFTIQVSKDGDVALEKISLGSVTSAQKLSYTQASDDALDGVNENVRPQVIALKGLAEALLEKRKSTANVQPSRSDFFIELNADQKIEAIHPRTSVAAHAWVEECMLAVNRCAAQYFAENAKSALYISHSGVRADRLESLSTVLNEKLPELKEFDLANLDGFVSIFRALQADDEREYLRQLMLRQLDRTGFSLEKAPHFALGFDAYTTISSPLRKANDYLLHRLLTSLIESNVGDSLTTKDLESIEEKQDAIRKSVFDIEQSLKCEYMTRQSGEFDAEVVRVFTTGMQVRVLDNGIEGVIATRDIEGKCSFNQDLMQLKTSKGEFTLAQKLKVSLKRVDWSKKQIQFSLA